MQILYIVSSALKNAELFLLKKKKKTVKRAINVFLENGLSGVRER